MQSISDKDSPAVETSLAVRFEIAAERRIGLSLFVTLSPADERGKKETKVSSRASPGTFRSSDSP